MNNTVITPGSSSITVSIDANQRFLVNCTVYSLCGGVGSGDPDSAVLQAIAQAGFNTVRLKTSSSDTAATLAPVLENANADGLKAIVWFSAGINSSAMQSIVSGLINNYSAAAAAVITWYVYDEPNNNLSADSAVL